MTCRESAPWPLESGADTVLDRLTAYDPQWLALHNRLHRHREAWQGLFAGQPVTVQWSSVAQVSEPLRDVHLTLGGAALLLQLPTSALAAVNLAESASRDLDGLAGAMLLELALLGFIEPLERLTGQTLQVVEAPEVAECEPFVAHLTLSVALADGEPMAIPLHLSADATRMLAEHFEQHLKPARHALDGLAFVLKAQAGEADLSVAELRSLRPGDVVMLDDWPAGQIRLTLDDRLHARAELAGHTATLLEQPMVLISSKEPCMTESAVTSDLDSSLDELMLKLVCQVGSVELSIAQLRELGVGSVLHLTPQLQEGVDLMVNGRRIGQGQLVKIGDGLGVRLSSLVTP
jgi:type III secretion protein Q